MRTKAENFRNAPKPNFDLYDISFICTNFEAFTTFSAIFTRIRRANGTVREDNGKYFPRKLRAEITNLYYVSKFHFQFLGFTFSFVQLVVN